MNKLLDHLTPEQKEHLIDAFKAVVSLNTADITDNHSRCGCFHIDPFHKNWDKRTTKEVLESIRSYVSTWILYPLSQVVCISPDDVTTENLIYWHRLEASKLENQLKEKNNKK